MSRIEEMIRELCPEGVEYKTIQETVGVNRGKRLTKSQLSDEGKYEVYHGSKDTILGKYIEYNAPANTVIVVNTGGIGGVKFLNQPFWCSDGSFWLGHANYVNPKFLYYYLSGYEDYFYSQKRIGGVPTIDRGVIEQFEIPVPPIAIQNEIVNILDMFTELEAKLEAKLEAELEARRKQYEYYRNKLLNFSKFGGGISENVKWLTMNEVCNIYSGKNKIRNEVGEYPVYGSTGIIAYSDKYVYNTKQILIARVGANAGYVHIANGEYDVSDNTLIVDIQNGFSLKYIYYMLVNMNLGQYAKGGGQPLVTAGEIKQLLIPIPSITEQQRIVAVLDKFETLVNDISEGLPAEIAARRQQYEYYRDKLLTFKRKDDGKIQPCS